MERPETVLWTYSFTTVPKNPAVPSRQEWGCVSVAQLGEMQRELIRGPGSDQYRPVSIDMNTPSAARFTLHCPPITIPQLGIKAPGADLPGRIERTRGEDHWTVSIIMPGAPGGAPASVWQHEYRRLSDCQG
ncbi:hypothetical protein [Sphingobium sp.]|uniref:hypothetical protein n=1 Tax=Sphingobium sp. TaxID=1912891 RepID=UPI003B3AB695